MLSLGVKSSHFPATLVLGLLASITVPSPLLGFQCATAHGPCGASQPGSAEWNTYARVNGQNYTVKIALGAGEAATQWSGISPMNGMPDRCICNAGHKTSCGRGFWHFHNTFQIPPEGRNATFVKRTQNGLEPVGMGLVTKQMIEDFWDWEYAQDGFTRIAGSGFDPSVNCHGYSMGLGTCVNSMDFMATIKPDDWSGGTFSLRDSTLYTADASDHSAQQEIVYVTNGMGYTPSRVRVSEKFLDSPLYEKVSPDGIADVSPKSQLYVIGLNIGWGTNHARRGMQNVGPPPGGSGPPGMP